MADMIVPRDALLNWANAQIENLPTLTDCYLRLITAPLEISWYTTLEELEAAQATYPGYDAVQLVGWSTPVIPGVDATTEADIASFQATELTTAIAYGCYMTSADGTRWWGAAPFLAPVAISDTAEFQIVTSFNLRSLLGSP